MALALFGMAVLALAGPAAACTVCIIPPEKTAVDHLVRAHHVVLAREDPAKPFRFTPAETLKGVAAALVSPAMAHEVQVVAGGLETGFLHPLLGWDHVAAIERPPIGGPEAMLVRSQPAHQR